MMLCIETDLILEKYILFYVCGVFKIIFFLTKFGLTIFLLITCKLV